MAKLLILLALAVGAILWFQRRARSPRMPASEARKLLGVDRQAGADQIREAHRRLIARVHPDTGGSAELATRVNAARDALLKDLKRK